MIELDLHGKKHEDIEPLVENTVLLATDDVRIITGNSTEMQKIVLEVLNKHELTHVTFSYNLGEIIVIYNA